MSNRRLIRHGPGVLMALLLLATLVPISNAQTVPAPAAGTGAVQGIVVDANTREPLVEVINVIVVTAAVGGAPVPCPATVVSINPLTSTTNLPADIAASVNALTGGGTLLNCTSLTSNIGRWGFSSVPAGVNIQHYAFKTNYAPHSDTFTVIPSVAGTVAAGLPIQHEFSIALQVAAGGGQAGATSGSITGTVAFTACTPVTVPPCVPP